MPHQPSLRIATQSAGLGDVYRTNLSSNGAKCFARPIMFLAKACSRLGILFAPRGSQKAPPNLRRFGCCGLIVIANEAFFAECGNPSILSFPRRRKSRTKGAYNYAPKEQYASPAQSKDCNAIRRAGRGESSFNPKPRRGAINVFQQTNLFFVKITFNELNVKQKNL